MAERFRVRLEFDVVAADQHEAAQLAYKAVRRRSPDSRAKTVQVFQVAKDGLLVALGIYDGSPERKRRKAK